MFKTRFWFCYFFSGREISKLWAYDFIKSGAYVIDNSNAFRRDKDIPLVVPEINSYLINKESKLIANPNCSTIQLAIVIDQIKKIYKTLHLQRLFFVSCLLEIVRLN